jgi:hypothetical protein
MTTSTTARSGSRPTLFQGGLPRPARTPAVCAAAQARRRGARRRARPSPPNAPAGGSRRSTGSACRHCLTSVGSQPCQGWQGRELGPGGAIRRCDQLLSRRPIKVAYYKPPNAAEDACWLHTRQGAHPVPHTVNCSPTSSPWLSNLHPGGGSGRSVGGWVGGWAHAGRRFARGGGGWRGGGFGSLAAMRSAMPVIRAPGTVQEPEGRAASGTLMSHPPPPAWRPLMRSQIPPALPHACRDQPPPPPPHPASQPTPTPTPSAATPGHSPVVQLPVGCDGRRHQVVGDAKGSHQLQHTHSRALAARQLRWPTTSCSRNTAGYRMSPPPPPAPPSHTASPPTSSPPRPRSSPLACKAWLLSRATRPRTRSGTKRAACRHGAASVVGSAQVGTAGAGWQLPARALAGSCLPNPRRAGCAVR